MKSLYSHYDTTKINDLPRVNFPGRIVVVNGEAEAERAVDYLMRQDIIGLDTETKPNFKKGGMNAVALLQISSREVCFLFRLCQMGLPDCLVKLLEDRSQLNVPPADPVNQVAERLVDADNPDEVRDLPADQVEAESVDDAPERPLPPPIVPPAVLDDESSKPVLRVVEQLPSFPGGMMEYMKWLSRNLKYPPNARQAKIQGTVMASFVVNSDGTTADVKVVKSAEASLDREALRVLRMMPRWEPGVSEGKPCRTLVHIPVVFKL